MAAAIGQHQASLSFNLQGLLKKLFGEFLTAGLQEPGDLFSGVGVILLQRFGNVMTEAPNPFEKRILAAARSFLGSQGWSRPGVGRWVLGHFRIQHLKIYWVGNWDGLGPSFPNDTMYPHQRRLTGFPTRPILIQLSNENRARRKGCPVDRDARIDPMIIQELQTLALRLLLLTLGLTSGWYSKDLYRWLKAHSRKQSASKKEG